MSNEFASKVDCVAFSMTAAIMFSAEGRLVTTLWYPVCCHPDRENYQEPDGQYGCKLVDFDSGEPVEGATCAYQAPVSEEASGLQDRILRAFRKHEVGPDNF